MMNKFAMYIKYERLAKMLRHEVQSLKGVARIANCQECNAKREAR